MLCVPTQVMEPSDVSYFTQKQAPLEMMWL